MGGRRTPKAPGAHILAGCINANGEVGAIVIIGNGGGIPTEDMTTGDKFIGGFPKTVDEIGVAGGRVT